MSISIISAIAKNGAIGKKNSLPWYLPADLKHFKETTTGKTIVMGLNTFKSIGKALPNRKNVVLTTDAQFQFEGITVAHSIEKVLEMTKNDGEVMICGGASVYKQFLPLAQRLYLTYIHHHVEGDIFFPEFNKEDWKETIREDHEPEGKNLYLYSFVVLEKK